MSEQEKCPKCGAKATDVGEYGEHYECDSELLKRHPFATPNCVFQQSKCCIGRECEAMRCQLATVTFERDQLKQRVAELKEAAKLEIRVQQAYVDCPSVLGREWHKYHEGSIKTLRWVLGLISQESE